MQQEGIEWYELFLQHQKLKRTVQALCRVWISLAPILKPVLQVKQHTGIVFDQLQQLFQLMPKKFACKMVGWSPHIPTHASFRTERSADTESNH